MVRGRAEDATGALNYAQQITVRAGASNAWYDLIFRKTD